MSFIGGYQSDVNLNDIKYVGDFPADHSLGGYGIAIGTNGYVLTLNPVLSQYRDGLTLEVKFQNTNTGASLINVNGKGNVPIKKIVDNNLVDVEPNDLKANQQYILIFDGTVFQVANLDDNSPLPLADENKPGISERATQGEVNTGADDERHITALKLTNWFLTKVASEATPGISMIASQAEVNAGGNDLKFVTPAKLASYVADKLTGLWKDKGLINASTNPNYPAGQIGDAYTISVAGKIGGALGDDVQVRDVIYCTANNPGGNKAAVGNSWNIIQSNLVQATEAIAGFAQIATQAEVNAGVDNSKYLTPLKLVTWFAAQLATEAQAGISERATQAEVNAGADDLRHITPLKLVTWFASQLATEVQAGISERATQAEVNAGTDDVRYVSPLKLTTLLNTVVQQATEAIKGIAEIATQAETDAGLDDSRIITPLKLQVRLNNYINRESILLLPVANVNPNFYFTPGRNQIALVNGNLVVVRDFRFKPNTVPAVVSTHVLNFPKPVNGGAGFSGILISNVGERFMYSIDSNGRVSLFGTFNQANDELLFNINPYVAKFPIEYYPTQPPS
ncbi:hypothetical protein HYX58_06540 [Candidatus Dependentiae bacterium]|nr:hypothetical protein [Candidatus Dependentiae bacterium]